VNKEEITELFKQTGALSHGHFKLTSGRHSDTYIQCARIQERPILLNQLAAEISNKIPDTQLIDCVIAPAVGGIVFGYAVASILGKKFMWTERVKGTMELRRSFEIEKGQTFLVCEDVVTTGGSVKEVIDLVEEAGACIVGVASMIDRAETRKFDAPYYPLVSIPTPSWRAEDCELCKKGVKVKAPGSRGLAC
jgi:orotate phosphoribosyltransferase